MFKFILAFSGFLLASCAAFFSVKGIALLFAASFWSVALMAASLELGKLISASYLYRYWKEINKILRNYMLGAVILLMGITSLGIFGFLSDAFQRNFSQYSLNIAKINSLKNQQIFLASQIDFNKNKLKDLIELQKTYQSSLDSAVKQEVTTTKTTGGGFFSSGKTEKVTDQKLLDSKNKVIENSQTNINQLFTQISTVTSDLQNLEKQASESAQEIIKLETDNTKGEIGTFKFVAEAFGVSIETAVRIFIVLIVIVFDPLAVCLVIAYNSLFKKKDNTELGLETKIEFVNKEPHNNSKITETIEIPITENKVIKPDLNIRNIQEIKQPIEKEEQEKPVEKENTIEQSINLEEEKIESKESDKEQGDTITSKVYANFNYTNRRDIA